METQVVMLSFGLLGGIIRSLEDASKNVHVSITNIDAKKGGDIDVLYGSLEMGGIMGRTYWVTWGFPGRANF